MNASYAAIICVILVCDQFASVLFDLRSTFSYMSTYYVVVFDLIYDSMPESVYVFTPVDETLVVDQVNQFCLVTLEGYNTWVDLIILVMVDFDLLVMLFLNFML